MAEDEMSIVRIPRYARDLVKRGQIRARDFVGAEPFLFDAVASWVAAREARHEADFADESGLPILDRPPVRAPFAKVWAEWQENTRDCGALVESTESLLSLRLFVANKLGPDELMKATVSLLSTGQVAATFVTHDPWNKGLVILRREASEQALALLGETLEGFYKSEGTKWEERSRKLLIDTVHTYQSQQEIYTSPEDVLRDHEMNTGLSVVLWGFALCHAKNISAPLTDLPRAARRSADKEGVPSEVPARQFRILQIGPVGAPRSSLNTLGREEVSALHLVRGHFVRYSDTAPLFGKYAGTFWRSPHMRGDAAHGSISKIYEPQSPVEAVL